MKGYGEEKFLTAGGENVLNRKRYSNDPETKCVTVRRES